jgi:hypothetical protein
MASFSRLFNRISSNLRCLKPRLREGYENTGSFGINSLGVGNSIMLKYANVLRNLEGAVAATVLMCRDSVEDVSITLEEELEFASQRQLAFLL